MLCAERLRTRLAIVRIPHTNQAYAYDLLSAQPYKRTRARYEHPTKTMIESRFVHQPARCTSHAVRRTLYAARMVVR